MGSQLDYTPFIERVVLYAPPGPLIRRYDTIWSPLPVNLLRMAFVPVHHMKVSLLPIQTIAPDEKPEEFATRVAGMIADELGVVMTEHTTQQKRILIDRAKAIGRGAMMDSALDLTSVQRPVGGMSEHKKLD